MKRFGAIMAALTAFLSFTTLEARAADPALSLEANAAYLRAAWQDAFIRKLDLTAMLQLNLDDHSRLNWLEARYHWDRTELALQWQLNSGNASSARVQRVPSDSRR